MIQNLEAERTILGVAMLDQPELEKLEPLPVEDDFTSNVHKAIWRAVERNMRNGVAVDVVTVLDVLEAVGDAEKVGGMGYLADLIRMIPTTKNYKHYYGIVKQLSGRRQAIAALKASYDEFQDLSTDFDDVLQNACSRMEAQAKARSKGEVVTLQQAAMLAYTELNARMSGEIQPVYTGIGGYDKLTGGMFNGELTVLGGRPGKGKSALSWQIAEHVSADAKVLFLSREMPPEQLGQRALARATGISSEAMRNGSIGGDDYENLISAIRGMHGLQLDIDAHSRTPRELRSLMRGKGYRLLVCDYIQIMAPNDNTYNREQEVANITRALKELAVEYKIPVLGLSQLNREPEKRTGDKNKAPKLSDLRESGALEQDADNVLFIHEPEECELTGMATGWFEQCMERDCKYIELIIQKQRMGRTGWVPLEFEPGVVRYSCLTSREG